MPHLAPIIGQAWVGYIPSGRVVGISKLARVVEVYAKRLQIQEKMTAQIANTINDALKPQGVGVVIKAQGNESKLTKCDTASEIRRNS